MANDTAKHLRRKSNMAKGFEVYQLYNATNLGFAKNTDYRTYKYNGKVNNSLEKFSESPFKFRCVAIGRKMQSFDWTLGMYGLAMKHGGYIPPKALTHKNLETQANAMRDKYAKLSSEEFEPFLKEIMAETGPVSWDELVETNDENSLPILATKAMSGEIDWIIPSIVYSKSINPFTNNTGFLAKSFIDELRQHAYYIDNMMADSRSAKSEMHRTWLRLVNEA